MALKLKTDKFTSADLPAIDLSQSRWDNRDPKDDMAAIFKEFLDDQEKIEAEIDRHKSLVKARQAAKADLRKIVSGRLGLLLGEVDAASKLAAMSAEERQHARHQGHRALVLACEALGVDVPAVQIDMDELWSDMTDMGPVADNTEAAA